MRLRYSFKWLLIIFTVLAVCIGMFAVRLHRARQQRATVAALEAAGVTIMYRYETWHGEPVMNVADPFGNSPAFGPLGIPGWKLWLGRQFGRDFVFGVDYVFSAPPLSADLIARLPHLRGLKRLHLNVGKGFTEAAWDALVERVDVDQLTLQRHQQIGDARRLAGLAAMRNLRVLTVDGDDLTIEDAQEIAGLHNLRELTLSLVGVSNSSLEPLAKLNQLESFVLVHRGIGRDVTSDGVAFVAGMPNLQTLTLGRIETLDDNILPHIEVLAKLESLQFDQLPLTGIDLQRLTRLPRLKSLNLIGTQVDDQAMQQLAKLSQLQALDISYTKVTDAGLKHVAALNKLRSLAVSGDAISDVGLAEIARLTQLEELAIGRTNATDEGLLQLAKLQKLSALTLNENPKITKAGVAALKNALPECNFY